MDELSTFSLWENNRSRPVESWFPKIGTTTKAFLADQPQASEYIGNII